MALRADRRLERWRRLGIATWTIIGILLLVAAGLWLFGKVAPALVPFALALVLVFLFRGPVDWLEKKGVKRGLGVAICYVVATLVLVLLGLFILPPIVDQIREFATAFPGYYERAYEFWLDLQDQYQALTLPPWAQDAIANAQDSISAQLMEWSSSIAKGAFDVGGQALGFLLNGLLALVAAFWLLKDMPKITEEMYLLGGTKRRDEMVVLTEKINRVLGGYLRGQLIISLATGVIVAIGLSVFGVPYALVIGLLTGVLNVVPWVGPAIGALIAGISGLFVSPLAAVLAVATVAAAQQLTDLFITPRVMSEQVDLHPLLVIFSLLAGATLFGFVGILLAIPVAAVAKGLFVHFFEKYTNSHLQTEDGAFFRKAVEDEDEDDDDPPVEGKSKRARSKRTDKEST